MTTHQGPTPRTPHRTRSARPGMGEAHHDLHHGPQAGSPASHDLQRDLHRDLADLGVRELVAELARVEDALRQMPFMVRRHGMMVVNPDVAPLLARQRAVSAQLRQRRVSWNAHPASGVDGRGPSAAWPAPPWS